MTDSNRTLDEVPALLEDRRRYEVWLAALDARRDATPAHVFERVHADYRNRLQQVAARLATHRKAIEEERTNLVSRLSLLDAEERMRRDERAELELRAHVGELGSTDASSAFNAVDDALTQLVSERGALQGRVDELGALLAERPPTEIVPSAAPGDDGLTKPRSAEPAPTPGESFDEMAFLDAVVGRGAPKPGQDSGGVAPTRSAAEQATVAPAALAAAAAAAAPVAVSAPAYESTAPRTGSEPESLLSGVKGAGGRESNEAPLAANVTANTPIVLRTSGAVEQTKTLKCNECGSMNYPTEWYCERCGAELAAL